VRFAPGLCRSTNGLVPHVSEESRADMLGTTVMHVFRTTVSVTSILLPCETADVSSLRQNELVSKDATLIAEIERDLLDGKPLAELLRKCVVLSGQAGSPELRKWATQELRGYDKLEDVPKYRIAHLAIYVDAVTGGAIVSGQQVNSHSLPEFCRDHISEEVPLMQGVGEIEAMIATGKSARIPLPGWDTIAMIIDRESGNPFQQTHALYWNVTTVAMAGVLDNARTTLAELVAELRVALPRGQETPTAEQLSQAVSVAVHGRNPKVVVSTAQASGGSTSTVTAPPPVEEKKSTWWTRWGRVGAIVVGSATVITAIPVVYAYFT